MRKEIIIITAMLLMILVLAISSVKAQDSAYVYLVRDSAQLITTNKIIISNDYVNVLLEPIPGKATKWTIIREEHDPEPVVIRDSVMVDGRASTFSGAGWIHTNSSTAKWYNKTLSFNNTVGATIEYAFTGYRINWYAERKSATHGSAQIFIDDVLVATVNLRNGTQALDIETNLPIFKSGELTNGPHIIRIRILEARYIVHDAFKVFSIR